MKRNFYFFRHGQTDENERGMREGRSQNAALTELGRAQTRALAGFLADKKLDIIYSSPYPRAMDTAAAVAEKYSDLKIVPTDALVEGAFYFWGLDNPETKARVDAVFARVKDFLDGVIANTAHQNIAISSHGGITRALCWCAGKEFGLIKNCNCYHFTYEDGRWEFVGEFDTGIEVKNYSDRHYDKKD